LITVFKKIVPFERQVSGDIIAAKVRFHGDTGTGVSGERNSLLVRRGQSFVLKSEK